jgi:hypothetical protein
MAYILSHMNSNHIVKSYLSVVHFNVILQFSSISLALGYELDDRGSRV